MATPSMASGFRKYSSKFNLFFEPAITWDSKNEGLVFRQISDSKTTLAWHISMLITVDLLGLGSSVYVLSDQYFRNHGNLTDSLMIWFFAICDFYAFTLHFLVSFYGKEAVNGWNEMKKWSVKFRNPGKENSGSKRFSNWNVSRNFAVTSGWEH